MRLWHISFVLTMLAMQAFGDFSGKCVGVSDGDTISVMDGGASVKIRLHGVDCPESRQDYGNVAKQFTSAACYAKTVSVVTKNTDRYGRTIGIVTAPDGRVLNEALLEAGLAWWYQSYAKNETRYQQLEQSARNARVGLWSMANPTPPWDFRHSGKSKAGTQPAARRSWPDEKARTNDQHQQNNTTPDRTPSDREQSTPQQVKRNVPGDGDNAKVYVAATGKKYHRSNCKTLRNGHSPINLGDAQARGYTRCKVCNP